MLLLANSLIDGFVKSNGIGRGIVWVQLLCSVVMFAVIFGKWRELGALKAATRRFLSDFAACNAVLEYYITRRPLRTQGIEGIYNVTCTRLLKLLTPDARGLLVRNEANGVGTAALTSREIDLVRGSCEHALDETAGGVEYGMGLIATVVAVAPMLGLLGTVWGVLDAFYEMGSAGSANLATIAPSISSALVTTVVGLLIAFPGIIACNVLNAMVRSITSEMEGFVDELMGRVACELQGRGV